jgi:hypothetical protein
MFKYSFPFLSLLIFAATPCLSQHKTSLSVYVGSGVSAFGGPGAAAGTTYYISDASGIPSYVGDPYGSRSFTNWLAGARLDRQLNKQWRFSLNTQYEYTGGKVSIDHFQSRIGIRDTSGEFQKKLHFISINPQAGIILLKKRISIVANAGIDYAWGLGGGEDYIFFSNGHRTIKGYSGIPGMNDVRLTGGLLFILKKWSLDLSYKHGLRNYWKGSSDKAFSRIFQFRLLYAMSEW